jgi:ATP-dependent DNA helicase RecQ
MPSLDHTLRDVFGISSFRSHQEAVVESILAGRDTLVVMPTGGGKSLCYQLPAVVSEGTALVVSPLIALMKDQVDKLTQLGVSVVALNSAQQFDDINRSLEAIERGHVKLIYVSPERLESPKFREFITRIPLSFIAIDEAHCISEWGHDFRTSYRRIPEFYDLFEGKRPPVIALTATATPTVRRDIVSQLQLHDANEFVAGFARPNIRYGVQRGYDKKALVTELAHAAGGSTVIYTSSRARTDEIALHLRQQGFKAESYHAGMMNAERLGVQERFQNSKTGIIVATSAFGMGIDKADVRAVIHYDVPATLEAYYQESGRAGRDGAESYAILLYNSGDENVHEFMLRRNFPTHDELVATYQAIREAALTTFGFEQTSTVTIGEQTLKRQIPNLSANVGRIIEVLAEGGFITVEESAPLASAKVELLMTSQQTDELIFKTRSSDQIKMLKHFQILRKETQSSVLPIDEEHLVTKLTFDRTQLRSTVRILETKGAIRYMALPTRRTGTSYTIRLQTNTVNDPDMTSLLDRLDERMQHTAEKLQQMVQYCMEWNCRTQTMLAYFGERSQPCGTCDVCTSGVFTV